MRGAGARRTWRGAWARRGGLATLAAMSLVVVAGAVTVIGFADRAGSSLMLAAPLVLLGLVAVPATGQELGSARRDEIAVARLRGLYGGALTRLLAVEPGLAVLAGGLLGYAVGTVGVWATTVAWLGDAAVWAGWPATVTAAALVLATLVAVLAGMAHAIREPLSEQVSIAERPRAMTTAATFVSLLVVVAAAVATYRAQSAGTDDPAWVVLVGPALVALASGQVAVWVLRLLTDLLAARSIGSGVPVYLAVRRLRGTAGIAGPVRLLVSATVLATLALAGAGRVATWTDHTARLESGAATRVGFDQSAIGVLQLTRTLDPQGRWLMAAVFVPGTGGGSERRTFLDTERYDAVVGDFLDDSTGIRMTDRTAELRAGVGPAMIATGDTWRIGLAAATDRSPVDGLRVTATLHYLDDNGYVGSATARTTLDGTGSPRVVTAGLEGCRTGCIATGLTVAEPGGDGVPLLLTALELGQDPAVDVLEQPWVLVDGSAGQSFYGPAGVAVTPGPNGGLALQPDRGPLPVLATPGLEWPSDGRIVETPGGVDRVADVVGELDAGPFVQATGLVADLPRALVGDSPTVPAAEVYVLARSGTPAAMLDALAAAGGSSPTPLAAVRDEIVADTGAGQARAFALMALFCLAVAVLALSGSAARLRSSYRREVAALRLVGVPAGQIRRAGRAETALLAVAVVGTGVVGGVLAVRLLLGSLPVVRLPADAPALGTAIPWWAVLVAAGVSVLALAGVQSLARSGPDRATRPSILREGAAE